MAVIIVQQNNIESSLIYFILKRRKGTNCWYAERKRKQRTKAESKMIGKLHKKDILDKIKNKTIK